jgi:hypothetical protein
MRRNSAPWSLCFILFAALAGCAEDEPAAPPPDPAAEAPEPTSDTTAPEPEPQSLTVRHTAGRVDFTLLRPRMERVPEVLLIATREQSALRELLEKQLTRYQDYRAALREQDEVREGLTREERVLRTQIEQAMRDRERESLTDAFQALRADFPPPVELESEAGTFTTRESLVQPFWKLYNRLNPFNFPRHVPLIEAKLKQANEALVKGWENAPRGAEKQQFAADLKWLEQLFAFSNERLPALARRYERVVNEMFTDLARHPDQEWVESLMDPIDRWEYFLRYEVPQLRAYLGSNLVASTPTGQDGTFALENGGMLVVRIALDGQELFIPEGSETLPLTVEELRRWREERTLTPDTTAEATTP